MNNYRLELWDREHRERLAFLDAVDQGSVQITEKLNGQHTLAFRLAQDDPVAIYEEGERVLQPRQIVRLVDNRVDEWRSTDFNSFGSNYIDFSAPTDVSDLAVNDYIHLATVSPTNPYITKIESIDSANRKLYVSRDPTRYIASQYTGVIATRNKFDFFRINRIRQTRDDSGVMFVNIECEHHSYDMLDRPFLKGARSDLSYSQDQYGGSVQAVTVSASTVVNDVISNFDKLSTSMPADAPWLSKTDTTSFGVGTIDFTSEREMTFNRDSCLDALRKIRQAWEGDLRYNLDGTVDLLYMNGQFSNLQVDYGKNLNSVSKETDISSMFNVVYPVGASSAWEDNYSGIYGTAGSVTASLEPTKDVLTLASGDAKKFRYGDILAVWDGAQQITTTGATDSTITGDLATAGWVAGELVGTNILVTSGSGTGQMRQVVDNSTTTITVDRKFDITPSISGTFWTAKHIHITDLLAFGIKKATVTTATASTVTQADHTLTVNEYSDGQITIIEGLGVGQRRMISSNSATVFTIAPDWDTQPDTTSIIEFKAPHTYGSVATNEQISVSPLPVAPANNSYVVSLDAEEPLRIGKSYDYRSHVSEYKVPTVSTALTTISMPVVNNVSEAKKFLDNKVHSVTVYETILSSLGIPLRKSLETTITSVSYQTGAPYAGYLICPYKPLTATPSAYGTTASSPSEYSRVEALSLYDSTSVTSWGAIAKTYAQFDQHSALMLGQDAQRTLGLNTFPKARFTFRIGDLYEFDYLQFSQDEVKVGDLFQFSDTTGNIGLTGTGQIRPPSLGYTQQMLYDSITTDASSTYSVVAVNSTYTSNWLAGQFHGYMAYLVSLAGAVDFAAVVTNTETLLITQKIDSSLGAGAGLASVDFGMRINSKTWNPFQPDALQVEITHGTPINFYDDINAIMKKQKVGSGVQPETALARPQQATCSFWDFSKRQCGRTQYPNWFCNSEESNRDGKMTAELHPITKAHCTAHRPLDQKMLATDEYIAQLEVFGVGNETFDSTNRWTVNTDFIVFKDQCTLTLDGVTKYGGLDQNDPVRPDAADYQIQTYDNGEVVPTDLNTKTGCYIQYRNPPGYVDCNIYLTASIRGSGKADFSYVG